MHFRYIPEKVEDKVWVGGYQAGQRPGDIYAFKAEGIYKSVNEIQVNL